MSDIFSWQPPIYPSQPPVTLTFPIGSLTSESLESIRQIVREEMDAAIERYHQHGLDRLLAAVDAEPEPEDNVVAVLATMTEEEWETLVQRVRERKAHEQR